MARAASRKTTRTTEAAEQKRRPGRPAGSKNRVMALSKAKPRVVASPKMNKVELEAHVVKLERTVTRLREQNKELKLAAAAPSKIAEAPKKPAKLAKSVKPAKSAPRSAKAAVAAPVKTRRRSSKAPAQDTAPVVA
jgi:hypothetical protein